MDEFLCELSRKILLFCLTSASFLPFATGVATFIPSSSVVWATVGKNAVLVWNYTVDNRNSEFSSLSPTWDVFNSSSNKWLEIANENKNDPDPWKWSITSECPPSLKGRVEKKKDSAATLIIKDVRIEDSGRYRCSLQLTSGSPETEELTLTVTAVPQINPLPHSPYYIKEGDNLAITCSATGPPVPSVKWVNKDGTELPGASGTATLEINIIQRSQSGLYKCLASNNPNEDPVNATITVVVTYPPYFTSLPKNKTVNQTQSVSLNCDADGFLKPIITWSRLNGNKIESGQVSNNKLTITSARKSDDGEYICTATIVLNSQPFSYKITAHAYITVKYEPSILKTSSNKVVNETDSLRLTCTADGYPTPSFTWSKSPGTITSSDATGNEYNIQSVSRSDAGTYTCTASNGIGKNALANIQVTVQYKPTIDVSLSSSNISSWVGDKVTLKCFAHGLPAPYFTWYMSGNQQITSGVTNVTNGSHVTTTTTEESIAYGFYKCQARNVAGFDEYFIYITQLFAPGLPNITMTEDDIEAVSITVRWTKPDYDGGTTVIDYIVQVNSTNPPQKKNTSNNQVEFTGLKKNTKYEVKVFARNKVGYGNSTIKIITTKKQGPPSSPDIQLESNQTAITLSWLKPDENGGEIANYTIYANCNRIDDVISSNSELKYVIYIKKLTPGTTYYFIVTAMNQFGESVKDQNKAKSVRIPEVTTPATVSTTDVITPDKEKRQDNASSSSPIVIAGAVGAVVLFIIAAVIAVIILRKKNLLGQGIKRSSKTNRATYHNDIDPDSGIHQGAVISLNDEAEGGIPTYAAVDISKKKNKAADIPNYAAVDMTKKKRPGEIIYAELADFNTAGTSAAEASRPITYTGTDYADISQFQKQDAPEATYANFPGRNKNFTNIQGM